MGSAHRNGCGIGIRERAACAAHRQLVRAITHRAKLRRGFGISEVGVDLSASPVEYKAQATRGRNRYAVSGWSGHSANSRS